MFSGMNDANAMYRAWRLAFLPALALLGVALPILFLSLIEQYLYYVRPLELIPIYGTAWLLLAGLVVPVSLIAGLGLSAPKPRSMRRIRGILALFLIGLAAAEVLAALAHGVLVWVRTFGLLATIHFPIELAALSLSTGVFLAILPRGRAAILQRYSVFKYGAALGALSLVTLPFSGWSTGDTATFASFSVTAATPLQRPNILLVTVDALSAEHMSLYGAERLTTPRLDAFAREATTFDRAYANGNFTTPGVSSILTGTRPWTHRALQLLSWPIRETRANSLPAMLIRAGYQTGYVATNPAAGATRNGLGSYFGFAASDRVPSIFVCRDGLERVLRYQCAATLLPPFGLVQMLWQKTGQFLGGGSPNRHFDPRVAMQSALEWLAGTDKRTPVFLWVHFLPPHAPYAAPAPWLGQFDSSQTARDVGDSDAKQKFLFARVTPARARTLEARYDESVKYVDYYIGEFLEQASRLLGPNTAVIVTADHGESFAHGYGGHAGPGLFESIIHIPLLVKLPSQSRGARTSQLAEQVDIAPTLAVLAGITPPSTWEGRSLFEIGGPSKTDATTPKLVFAMNFEENSRRSALNTGSVCLIDGRWKLVHFAGALHYPLMPQLHDQLYDLSADPRELSNRISAEPAEAERLRWLLSSELARHGGPLRENQY